jgi:hypothetical protein
MDEQDTQDHKLQTAKVKNRNIHSHGSTGYTGSQAANGKSQKQELSFTWINRMPRKRGFQKPKTGKVVHVLIP